MGRRSRYRQATKMGNQNLYSLPDDVIMLDVNKTDRRDAKKKSKKKKKQKKLRRKLAKQNNQVATSNTSKNEGSEKYVRWHKVMVQSETALEKSFLLSNLGNSIEVEFQPLGYHKIDGKACFYLEANESAASAILGLNNRVQGPDGTCLKIQVAKCAEPDLILNSDQLQVLREVMASRFRPDQCLLDLTDLHHDPTLLAKDILVPLASPPLMQQVLRQIRENIPQLRALNLSNNKLRVRSLKFLQSLTSTVTNLSALNLEFNKIGDIQVLKLIKMFPLTELSLQFNPFVEKYKTPVKYASVVKKELPALKVLDKVDVEAYLAENVKPKNENTNASKSSPSCITSGASEVMVRTFLEQYFALVDTPQRPNLLAAYTPDAILEVKSNVGAVVSTVFAGHEKISEALHNLPATMHNPNTFGLNILHPSPNSAQAVVTGQCLMLGVDSVVTFSRSMNIVPYNAGLCCSRDILELR